MKQSRWVNQAPFFLAEMDLEASMLYAVSDPMLLGLWCGYKCRTQILFTPEFSYRDLAKKNPKFRYEYKDTA